MTSIKYVWKNDEDVLGKSPSLTTLNAYLVNNSTLICPTKSSWRGKFRSPIGNKSSALLIYL